MATTLDSRPHGSSSSYPGLTPNGSAPAPNKRMSSLPQMLSNGPASRSRTNGSVTEPARAVSPALVDNVTCNACKKVLEDPTGDSMVVSFGNALWHVDCFRCQKCHSLVRDDTNLLILSDGSPVCENCSYICSACSLPISNEAIVTGDESYHAECFKCRTCASRIEELIFAKTSQGIYCMNCHNERVTRSRRHAEAKRNRTLKREREAQVQGTGTGVETAPRPATTRRDQPAENGLVSPTSAPGFSPNPAGGDGIRTTPSPQLLLDGQDLTASPPVSTNNNPPSRKASLSRAGSRSSPSKQRNGAHARGPSDDHIPVPSPPPGTTTPTGVRPTPTFLKRRTNSVDGVSPPLLPPKDPRALSGRRSDNNLSEAQRGGGSAGSDRVFPVLPPPNHAAPSVVIGSRRGDSIDPLVRPSTADGSVRNGSPHHGSGGKDDRPLSPLSRPYESSPSLSNGGATFGHQRRTSREGSGSGSSLGVQGGLTVAGANGKANRRSGFYGFQARPKSPDVGGFEDTETLDKGIQEASRFSVDEEDRPVAFADAEETIDIEVKTPPIAAVQPPTPVSPITDAPERPMSFYDPDTLLFLDAVSSPPQLPTVPDRHRPLSTLAEDIVGGPSATEDDRPSSPDIDHLSPVIGTADLVPPSTKDRQEVENERLSRELTRKVRKSIIQQRKASASGAGSSATKGATAQTMGMDLDLVEKLLEELENTKEKMKALQSQFSAMKRASRTAFEGFNLAREEYDREVAARRAAEEQMIELKAHMQEQASRLAAADTLKNLQKESQQLRTSVDGLQRKLSVLKVERDIKVAEVEALHQTKANSDPSTPPGAAIPRSLSNRLEVIKQGYRAQIDELANERDALDREVQHLRKVRDAQVVEFEELNRKSDALAAQNAQVQQELEQARSMLARVNARPGPGVSNVKGSLRHPVQSPSLSSVTSPTDTREAVEELHSDAHLATSRKFKWGKHAPGKPVSAPKNLGSHRPSPSVTDLANTNGLRSHSFQPVSVLRPVRCDYCGDKMWGIGDVRCSACGSYCHSKCAPNFFGCTAGHQHNTSVDDEAPPTGPSMFGNDLTAQARSEGVSVPRVVTQCIEAVEHNGLSFEGVYRKTGGMSQVKMVQACFDRGTPFDLHDTDRFNDISAVTSALKNYFRQLPNPLFTYELHEGFINSSALPQDQARVDAFERLVHQLPGAHFDTLATLMRHLHRVHLASEENKMTPQNLGVVFGPTLLRSQNPARQFSDMPGMAKIVEVMVENTNTIFRRPRAGSTASHAASAV